MKNSYMVALEILEYALRRLADRLSTIRSNLTAASEPHLKHHPDKTSVKSG